MISLKARFALGQHLAEMFEQVNTLREQALEAVPPEVIRRLATMIELPFSADADLDDDSEQPPAPEIDIWAAKAAEEAAIRATRGKPWGGNYDLSESFLAHLIHIEDSDDGLDIARIFGEDWITEPTSGRMVVWLGHKPAAGVDDYIPDPNNPYFYDSSSEGESDGSPEPESNDTTFIDPPTTDKVSREPSGYAHGLAANPLGESDLIAYAHAHLEFFNLCELDPAVDPQKLSGVVCDIMLSMQELDANSWGPIDTDPRYVAFIISQSNFGTDFRLPSIEADQYIGAEELLILKYLAPKLAKIQHAVGSRWSKFHNEYNNSQASRKAELRRAGLPTHTIPLRNGGKASPLRQCITMEEYCGNPTAFGPLPKPIRW